MSADRVEIIGASRIQHGPSNRRIYLMRLSDSDLPELPGRLIDLARERGYGKVFAKVPADVAEAFLEAGYAPEARVPGYFRGRTAADFLVFYTNKARAAGDRKTVAEVLKVSRKRANGGPAAVPPARGLTLRELEKNDAGEAAALYRSVFESYPFPIHDPSFLRRMMDRRVRYYGVWDDDRLVALASAEMDPEANAVEMTDFATRPVRRRGGLARRLLARMEKDLAREGYRTGYTIARARSYGMNITFARAGWRFGGTLWNNTQICGRLESMNVWHRPLRRPRRRNKR